MVGWDSVIEDTKSSSEMTDAEREAAISAFSSLRLIFGEEVFLVAHPLGRFCANRAPWTRKWVVWFAEALRLFGQQFWFPDLVNGLKDPEKYSERLSVFTVAARLATKGFTIVTDPEIVVNGRRKIPDLFVRFGTTEPGFYLEVSDLCSSQKERVAYETYNAISEVMMPYFFNAVASWHVLRTLAPAHLVEVLQAASATAEKALATSTLQVLDIEGTIRLGVAPSHLKDSLAHWAEQVGLNLSEGKGPEVEVNPFDRLANKLRDEQQQLPLGNSNVVVINTSVFCLNPGAEVNFKEIVHGFEEEVFRYRHIAYVVLVFHWMGCNLGQDHRFREHACFNRQRFEFLCESSMVVKNRFAAYPMNPVNEEAFLDVMRST